MITIQILGTGCAKCHKLAEMVNRAALELNIEYKLEKVTDLNQIMDFGVMITPALVVDGKVTVSGRVPKIDDIKRMLI